MMKAKIIHVISGVITGLSALVSPGLPIALAAAFIFYEIRQSKEIHDKAHPALLEFAIGIFVTTGIILILKLLLKVVL